MKYYVCKKMRLLQYLQVRGFDYVKEQKDRNNPYRLVWIFESTEDLLEAVEDYYSRKEFLNRDTNL